jgi:hypothetical protein
MPSDSAKCDIATDGIRALTFSCIQELIRVRPVVPLKFNTSLETAAAEYGPFAKSPYSHFSLEELLTIYAYKFTLGLFEICL